jgi:hypothetical protein
VRIAGGNHFFKELNDNCTMLRASCGAGPTAERGNPMTFKFVSAVLISGLMLAITAPAEAAPAKRGYQSGPQVKGYAIRRRGGYSYGYSDSISTNGDRAAYRGHILNPQTPAGPFDSGFFFDSAMGYRGGQAPYMN